ncbi:lysoplasmalogenase [Aeromonas cavernicola]|uniref:Lysoplasmalogenase n=1 Tax=Aeromonas cavernicola TaxID=1006623 RepID=A0A2H9U6K5_9GAMM|nr:lysoplasmalogenase [Aeromonas cavernicola]PJG59686.1 lysoplasmalogenase [Aeromonas cavernicola]
MLLSFLIIASGWWHVRVAHRSNMPHFGLSKPLTMLLIIALAFGYQGYDHDGSHAWILLGLCLSLAGDVLLMLPHQRTMQGAAAFLVAHLCYIVGFAQGPLLLNLLDALLLLVVAGALFGLLWGKLGIVRIPVFLYILTIIAMVWVAAGTWHASLTAGSAAIFVGSLLFLCSNSILALYYFRQPFPYAKAWATSSYFAAQFLIAASLAA